MVKDVKSNAGMVAGLVACATRSLLQSPKRCVEDELSGGVLVFNEFREETILPVSEIVDYLSSNKSSKGLHTSGIQCVCVVRVVVGGKRRSVAR